MATQVIRTQIGAAVPGVEQGADGRLARFIETAKELAEVYFSTRGTIHQLEPENRARLTVKEKTELDSDMLGF